jgi:hemoglobin-like flavoprotein
MALNAPVLRSTFELVVEKQPQLMHRFYEILFERHPRTKALFGRHSGAAQEKMLTEALTGVLDHLDDAPWLTTTLEGLGAKHRTYGVTDEMYEWVGGSLLAALAEAAGDDWSAEAETAWTEAFGAIASLMKAGAAAAPTAGGRAAA